MNWLLAQADARWIPLADRSVQCVVTSPPYFGLRDYGVSGQIGLEPTPDAYVAAMVGVFREVRRVLRDDGVCWLNLGDSYCNAGTRNNGTGFGDDRRGGMADTDGSCESAKATYGDMRNGFPESGIKKKDLIGIPWRVALALQADGWYLRSDVIWSKPNPMPESVTDRPTKSHEYVFLLSKSERYYYDADAVREAVSESTLADRRIGTQRERDYEGAAVRFGDGVSASRRCATNAVGSIAGRNLRSVWSIATTPYPGAHFATMPPALAERCIKAGSRPGDVVFDPFNGSGTTGAVATMLGRRYIGCDLSAAYLALAVERITEANRPVSRLDPSPAIEPLPGQLSLFS